MKKIVFLLLACVLLITSVPAPVEAVQKGEDRGEVLNLPPFVDFEVKEQRKVDVIVDVGNTSKTVDEVNDLVNEVLRPALAADGLDYKIHVEKSNEGKTRQYYYHESQRYRELSELWYFDIVTGENNRVYGHTYFNMNINNDATYKQYLTPTILEDEKHIIAYSDDNMLSVYEIPGIENQDNYKISPIIANNPGWSTSDNWRTLKSVRWASNITSDYVITADNKLVVYTTANINSIAQRGYVGMQEVLDKAKLGAWNLSSVNEATRALVDYEYHVRRDMFIQNNLRLYTTHDNGLYVSDLDKSYFRYYEHYKDFVDNVTVKNINKYTNSAYPIQIHKPTGDAIFIGTYNNGMRVTRYIKETGEQVTIPGFTQGNSYPLHVLDDGRTIFYVGYNSDRTEDKLASGWYIIDDFSESPTYLIDRIMEGTYENTIFGSLDSKIYMKLSSTEILIFDVDTKEKKTMTLAPTDREYFLIKYPDHLSTKKRYIKDVIKEVPYRTDAEKYYIRLDEYGLSQLRNSKELAKLATEMLAQQMTYIPLGNASNQAQHQKLLTTIGNKGRYIEHTDDLAAFTQAAAMITNRKEAELHVLVANETISLSTIKSSLSELQTELQGENILASINYIQGTSTSKLFDVINRIQWREDRNNYVVMFNRGSMTELDSMDYELDVANELNQYYAHYISVGAAGNAARNESLIATMKGNGTTTTSTSMPTVQASIKRYIMDSAVKNPKRVTDTLVLNYDQTTGAYRSDVLINTFYSDIEGDPKFNERFKTTHDPTVYENHTGLMEGIGQYQQSPTTQFTKVGKYEMVVQVQDNPNSKAAFANYRQWSLDSLSRLVLFVHRAPVAEFTATVNRNRQLSINNLSYDLDRYSQRNKGIISNIWKWKKVEDEAWTDGSPPTTLAANTDYFIALKVKDIDGAWSNEVINMVSTKDSNQPPVALFQIDPKSVSWNKAFTITDLSYDPDGDEIITREWQVYREGKHILTKATIPTTNEMKQAAENEGLNQLGQYQIRLRVQDSQELWSEWYSNYASIVNHPPIADYEPITVTYRDTLNTILNLTANPDQDGDAVTYRWRLLRDDKTYSLGTAKDVSFRIRDRGLGKNAIGTWLLELRAADPLGAESYMTHSFQVVNQNPTAEITSAPTYGYIDEAYAFTSSSDDPDSEDRSSLKYFWKVTTPTGKVKDYYTKDITNMSFDEKGIHTLEHWVTDQLAAESEIAKVSVNILNKKPIAAFTRTPITTYRGVDIAFTSQATDYDGWIETHRYELLRDNQSPLTLSTNANFTRSFSSIGSFEIRQTVTDNDGASDSISRMIHIVNRAPRAEVTEPSGTSAATATEFNTTTPQIKWNMTDADGDSQVQYQMQLKNEQGTVLRTTSITATSNRTYTLPNGWVTEGTIYRIAVRVNDGYDWSQYSSDKYFFITLNQAPEPGFTTAPSVLYEGDGVSIRHRVHDPDGDQLSVSYEVVAPNGSKLYYPSQTTNYQLSPIQYKEEAFKLSALKPGTYIIKQTVSDGKANPVSTSQSITVSPLGIVGQVKHTELWESYRLAYNEKLASGASKWEQHQFYSGERFMLYSNTTLTGSESEATTYAVQVTAILNTTSTSVNLSMDMNHLWSGSMWQEEFADLALGTHSFTFEVLYSNGVRKTHAVDVEIIGKASYFAGVQRWK